MTAWRAIGVSAAVALMAFSPAAPGAASAAGEPRPTAPSAPPGPWRIAIALTGGAEKTGDRVLVTATATNTSGRPLERATLLLGLVDLTPGQPVPLGLETWTSDPESAALPALAPGASASAAWHLVMIQPGPLGLYASVLPATEGAIQSSPLVILAVRDTRALNPGHVLPVALGAPLLLAGALVVLGRRRSGGAPAGGRR